ncbi:hypothetical protein P691DRAFT_715523 [Macrolepiota fuliginosa MF-IS2]|uniref:Uncharacterized protein n=1 Tax=Macrolepiota fuliginosa MF-IS2 TaxID=1400762 RepID=A0A9P5WYF4_9AGAR|nr:hypothetical protein P691DRAFT_715523 [Macrolepiota fuliginosa MF-IS2]
MEQFRRSGNMVSGETDIVSRLTSGFFNQAWHFTTPRATHPYRLAFLSSVLLMALNGLGPSAITVNPISLKRPLAIRVANLTTTNDLAMFGQVDSLLVNRANLIVRLEQFENVTYGFRGQEKTLIPWPASDLLSANGTITYPSDVITYDMNCLWKQPTRGLGAYEWIFDGYRWTFYNNPLGGDSNTPDPASAAASESPDPESGDEPVLPLMSFIFFGSSTQLGNPLLVLNLEDQPNTLLPKNTTGLGNDDPMIVTALVCDPQLKIVPATVTLTRGSLHATPHTPPLINNILPGAANTTFSEGLLEATGSVDPTTNWAFVNTIARVLFLTDPSLNYFDKPEGIKPLPLPQINQNMNKIMLSAAKAFLSGYKPTEDSNLTSLDFDTISTDATADEEQLALVGSKPFLIALGSVVGLLFALLATLTAIVKVEKLQTFDLESIAKIAKKVHIQ